MPKGKAALGIAYPNKMCNICRNFCSGIINNFK